MKYVCKIKNVDCVNCANKIEEYLNKDKKVNNVKINFNTLNISYETNIKNSISYLNKKIKKIEPNTYIYDKNSKNVTTIFEYLNLILGFVLALIGIMIEVPFYLNYAFIILGFILLLKRSATLAYKLLINAHTINENLLIIISSLGAFLIDKKLEGLMVITLYEFGKILESKAINKTRKNIETLINIKEDYAKLKTNKSYKKVLSYSLKIGDTIVVLKGDKVPVDGTIVKGNSYIDNSLITGESKLISVGASDKILSGSINRGDIIEIKVDALYKNSTVNKILNLVENATDKKSKLETSVNKYSKYYTLTILILSLIVAIFLPLITNCSYENSIYKALTFLVISCPCAIAISVPLSYFSSLGFASSKGILIKGSNYLDGIKNINTIIFDKTGTLTKGIFHISNVNINDKKYTKEDILKLFKIGEILSNHPIAKSLVKEINIDVDIKNIKDYKEFPGLGIEYKLNKQIIKIGNSKYIGNSNNLDNTLIFVSIDNKVIGSINIEDELKEEAKDVICKLKDKNITVQMFTGDNYEIAKKISTKIGISNYKYNMMPEDKYNELMKLLSDKKNNKLIAFVGDGINDTPVITLSDIGISMGQLGSDSAIESSDIVIANDNLESIISAINISKKTNLIVKENIIFALFVKMLILVLSLVGIANMWQAVFADVGVTIITILNTIRLLKGRYNEKNK